MAHAGQMKLAFLIQTVLAAEWEALWWRHARMTIHVLEQLIHVLLQVHILAVGANGANVAHHVEVVTMAHAAQIKLAFLIQTIHAVEEEAV